VPEDVAQLAHRIRTRLPRVKSGTLRFWGEWFGRPYDNVHCLVRCETEDKILRLYFNEDEVLSVWAPRDLAVSDQAFKIADAARVRWEWYSYGKPKIEANRYFLEYSRTADGIASSTNIDWYKPELKPTAKQPAVEIL
jgi:hypothetical protein